MAFDLEPGEYRFEMKYVPEGSGAGIMVSIMSIAAFCGDGLFLFQISQVQNRPVLQVFVLLLHRAAADAVHLARAGGREDGVIVTCSGSRRTMRTAFTP